MKTIFPGAWLSLLLVCLLFPAQADEQGASISQAQLDQMMAPVALYPDSLLSQILMAATYSSQVAEAVQWSRDNSKQEGDAAVKAVQDKDWDPSVASLVAFPQVLAMMGEKPDWVKQMGDAFLAEPETVMDTVQALRKKAKDAGNLESTEQQKVVVDDSAAQTVIVIESADPQVIYVPSYNPSVVYGAWWWPAYPPYYYTPPPIYGFGAGLITGIGFGLGVAITNSIWGSFDWRRRDVNINVNRYNNINVNRRLNVNRNNVSWKQNRRKGGGPRGGQVGMKPRAKKLDGAAQRNQFRGRDAQRDQARETLKRKGIDPAAERRNLSGSGGNRVRDQVSKLDREHRPRATQGAGGKTGLGNRKGAAAASQRKPPQQTNRRRDNAFKGLRDGPKAGLNAERGRLSNRSFKSHGGGGGGVRSHGAGGGGRAGGGGARFGRH